MIGFKVESSRTLRENPSSNWRTEWTMDVFLKAMEEVYALESSDRFMEPAFIWETISLGLAKDLAVDPRDMGKLSDPPQDVYATLKDLLYAFVASTIPAKYSTANSMFQTEFKQALHDDETSDLR